MWLWLVIVTSHYGETKPEVTGLDVAVAMVVVVACSEIREVVVAGGGDRE